jgi:hypothetical protein
VFQDQDKATEEAYETGEFFSVDFKALQTRLEDDCGIDLTSEQKADLKSFRSRLRAMHTRSPITRTR